MIPLDRKKWIERRKQIPDSLRREKESAIARNVAPYLKGKVAMYHAVRGEVDLSSYIDEKDAYFPHTEENTLVFYRETEEKRTGRFGIPEPLPEQAIEPNQLDVIVCPVVAFDHTKRIGYGAGYYDRYLPRTHALTIGLAFDCQECDDIVWHESDWELDMMITETRVLKRRTK